MPTTEPEVPGNKILGKETLIPIGAALGLCVVLVGGLLQVSERLLNIEYAIKDNRRSIDVLNLDMQEGFQEVRSISNDRWTHRDMQNWIERLRLSNPGGITVPNLSSQN